MRIQPVLTSLLLTSAGLTGCFGGSSGSSPEVGVPTPLTEAQVLADHEADLRRSADSVEHNLSATLARTKELLDAQPWMPPVAAGRGKYSPIEDGLKQAEEAAAAAGAALVTSDEEIVADRTALVALGKAFFWEMRAGSDGQTACATCHYDAGADGRMIPDVAGVKRTSLGVPQGPTMSKGECGPPVPPLGPDEDDRCGALGPREFLEVNTPSVIGATLFDRLFHDGSAASTFNGYDKGTIGIGDDIGLYRWEAGGPKKVVLRLPHHAAASQATAPLLSKREMSWKARTRIDVARKLLDTPILSKQKIEATDPVLGVWALPDRRPTYRDLIQKAFREAYWTGGPVGEKSYTVAETNFLIFWGLAIEAYEATLIPDQTPFDQWLNNIAAHTAGDVKGFGPEELAGFSRFVALGCAECHGLPETSTATQSHLYGPNLEFEEPLGLITLGPSPSDFVTWIKKGLPQDDRVERMKAGEGTREIVTYDAGFYDIGAAADVCAQPGLGRSLFPIKGFLLPWLSRSPLVGTKPMNLEGLLIDVEKYDKSACDDWVGRPDLEIPWILGATKAPMLRNLELTGPYFSARQALVAPYMSSDGVEDPDEARKIIREGIDATIKAYGSTFPKVGARHPHLHPAIKALWSSGPESLIDLEDVRLITSFLLSLTDPRVREPQGVFCTPSIDVPTDKDIKPVPAMCKP